MIHTQYNKLAMKEEETTAAFTHYQQALWADLGEVLTKTQYCCPRLEKKQLILPSKTISTECYLEASKLEQAVTRTFFNYYFSL